MLQAHFLPPSAHTMNPTPGTRTVASKQPVQANTTRQPSDSAVNDKNWYVTYLLLHPEMSNERQNTMH